MALPHIFGGLRVALLKILTSASQSARRASSVMLARYSSTLASVSVVLLPLLRVAFFFAMCAAHFALEVASITVTGIFSFRSCGSTRLLSPTTTQVNPLGSMAPRTALSSALASMAR